MSENICGFYFNLLSFLIKGNYPKRVTVISLDSTATISYCFLNKSTKTMGRKIEVSQNVNIF